VKGVRWMAKPAFDAAAFGFVFGVLRVPRARG
jgi:hypothetical protein